MERQSTCNAKNFGFPAWNQEPGSALLSREGGFVLRGITIFASQFHPSPTDYLRPSGDNPALLISQTEINIVHDYEIARDADSISCARPLQNNLRTLFQAQRARRNDLSMAMSLIGPTQKTPGSYVYDY